MLERQDTEDNITEEEFLRELQQTCLKKLRNYLCDHLEPERFFPYLQSKEYLDTDSCEQIRNMDTTRKKVNKMLDILIKSGTRPLEVLTRAIRKCGTTQKFICDKLENEYRKVREDPKNYERLWTIRNTTAPPPYTRFPMNYYPGNYPVAPASHFEENRYLPECPNPSQFTNDSSMSKTYLRSKSEEPITNPANVGSNTAFRYRSTSDGVNNQRQVANSVEFYQGVAPGGHPVHGSSMYPRMAPNGDSASSVIPQSFDRASHFNTTDFESRLGTMNEILRSQVQQEEKISLQNSFNVNEVSSISEEIRSNQEEEMRKCVPNRNPQTGFDQWYLGSRKPREHDASILCTRPGGNLSDTSNSPSRDVKLPPNRSVTTPKLGALANPPKTLPRLQSCQAGSIQPSCFNSANFEDVPSYAGPAVDSVEKKSTETPPMPHQGPRSTLTRSARVLEPIPSLQCPSDEPSSLTNGTNSIQIRRPPTEHDDTSMMPTSNFAGEEDESSLEISSDTD